MFSIWSDTVSVYFLSDALPPPPPIMPGIPPPPPRSPPPPPPPVLIIGPRAPGPPAPRLASAVVFWRARFAAALRAVSPKPNVRVMRRAAVNCGWQIPKFRGMRSLLAFEMAGTTPAQRVANCEQYALSAANVGRSFAIRSRFESSPVIMLNGGAELAVISGGKTSFQSLEL